MVLELLLLSVVLTTGYLGHMILRRFGPHQRVYGLMVVADLLLALYAFGSRRLYGPSAESDTIGVVAIGAGFCLVMLPPMVRDFGRRMLATDHLRLAKFASDLRELLQPGMGARQEAELIETILAVRQGREDEIVVLLEESRAAVDDPAIVQVIDERIVMTYLYAQRWSDAVRRYERITQRGHRPGSPQLTVEMVRAYCEEGELAQAAVLVELIESSPLAKESMFLALVSRARLVFLAFVGRITAVEKLAGPSGPLSQMPEAARTFWFGIARLNAGDASGARDCLGEAARLSGNDARAQQVAQEYLDRVDLPGQLGPHQVPIDVAELADRLSTLAAQLLLSSEQGTSPRHPRPLPKLGSVSLRVMPVTALMSALNIAASLAVYSYFGGITDLGALIAAGANLKAATLAGDWWRLATSTFLHVGVAHLALNVYGLWVLGRLVEQLHGSLRTLSIYLISGVVGALASTYLGGSATALGASGAVLGLMGAAVAELAVYRKHFPKQWARPLLRLLVVLSIAQIAVGFFYPIVDQWGHVGGLISGGVLGLLLSRNGRLLRTPRLWLAVILASLSLGFFGYAAHAKATTTYSDSLARFPLRSATVGGLRLQVPSVWVQVSQYQLHDPGAAALLDLQRVPAASGLDATISARLESETFGGALAGRFERAKPSARSELALPSPWRGGELQVSLDATSGSQRYRLVVFGKVVADEIWLGAYYHPAALTKPMEALFKEILASIEAAPASPAVP